MIDLEIKNAVLKDRLEKEMTIDKLCDIYNVKRATVYFWLKEAREHQDLSDNQTPYITKSESDREEYLIKIEQLEAEVNRLKQENSTLMKTLALLVNKQ